MKLHLPSGLRTALLACLAAVASVGTTLTTATLTGGVFAVTIAGQAAYAAEYTGANHSGTQIGYEAAEGTTKALNDGLTAEDTVTYNGISGWLPLPGPEILVTYEANIKVEGDGLTINDGSTGRTYRLTGDLSGNGQFSITKNLVNSFEFAGDLSQHEGVLKSTGASPTIIFSNGTADSPSTVASSSVEVAGTMRVSGAGALAFTNGVTVNSLNVETGTTFNGELTATTVNVTGSGALTVNSTTTITTLNAAAGTSLTIGEGVAVTLNGTATVQAAITNNGTIVFGENGRLTLSDEAFTQGADGSYTLSLFSEGSTGSMSGLTEDKLQGVVVAGRDWSFDETNGTISYVLTSNTLSYSGGELAWTVGAEMTGADSNPANFVDDDSVTFSGETVATLSSVINAAVVTVTEGSTLALVFNDNALNVASLELHGDLIYTDQPNQGNHIVAAEGSTGRVIVEWGLASWGGGGRAWSQVGLPKDFSGEVVLRDGGMLYSGGEAAPYSAMTVEDGGQLALEGGSNYSGLINLAGTGVHNEDTESVGALRATGGSTVSGQVVVAEEGATVFVDGTTSFTGNVSGTGSITKVGAGTMQLTDTNKTNTGSLIINEGVVKFGTGDRQEHSIAFSNITIATDARFIFNHHDVNMDDTTVSLQGGNLHAEDCRTAQGMTFGTLEVGEAGGTVSFGWGGGINASRMTGEGNLLVGRGTASETYVLGFDLIEDYNGTISYTGSGTSALNFYVTENRQSAGYSGTVASDVAVSSTSFHKTGEGSFTLGVLKASNQLHMNYEGQLTLAGLEIADGTLLVYDVAANQDALVSSAVTGAVTLVGGVEVDVTSYWKQEISESNSINLGLSESIAKENISVLTPGGSSELSVKDGVWHITSLNLRSDWDLNWGGDVLRDAPTELTPVAGLGDVATSLATATEGEGEAATHPYLQDGRTAILVTGGGGTNAMIIGGATDAAATLDSWIAVQGGTWGTIVGGCYANAWSGGTAANFIGDSHIAMKDGTVRNIIGGNFKDGLSARFTGDSYISIFGGTLEGSIIGGGVTVHSNGAMMDGDSHIYIYTPLTMGDPVGLGEVSLSAVVGGSLHAANTLSNKVSYVNNTEILVDLSGYNGEAVNFAKAIIGGNSEAYYYSSWGVETNLTTLVRGDTKIDITSPNTVTFTKHIIGGTDMDKLASNSTARVEGSVYITLNGGIYGTGSELNVIGGMRTNETRSGYTASVGGSNITINGAEFAANANIVGASYIHGGVTSSNFTHGDSTLLMKSGSVSGLVIGGYLIGGNGSDSFGTATLGDVSITIEGGSAADIYGGSVNWRNNAEATVHQGEIAVDLQGGTVGNVYAAGLQHSTATMETASTTVTVGSGVTFNAGSTLSGGYSRDSGAANASVTGARSLVLTGDAFDNLSGVTLRDFDSIDVQKAAANLTLGGTQTVEGIAGSADTVLTKAGAGTLTLSGADVSGTVTVKGGTLDVHGSELTAVTVMGGATLDTTTAGAKVGALTLGAESGDVASLKLGSGLEVGALSLTTGAKMEVLGLTAGGDYTLTLFTGLTADAISGITFTTQDEAQVADLATYITNAADFAGGQLILTEEGSLIISNEGPGGAWKWNTPAGGTWIATAKDGWDAPASGTTPDDEKLVFGDDGVATTGQTTIAISGPVAPKQVTVNASRGEYVFTDDGDDATTDGISGATSLVKEGAGKLTISLANTYSGGTTLNAGTLEATVTGALGTGGLTVNDGTFIAGATDVVSATNVTINGGTVNVTAEKAFGTNIPDGAGNAWDVYLNGGVLKQAAAIDNKVVFGGGQLQYTESLSVADGKIVCSDAGTIDVSVAEGKVVTWDVSSNVTAFRNGATISGGGELKITNANNGQFGAADKAFDVAAGTTFTLQSGSANADILSQLTGTGTVHLVAKGGAVSMQGDNSAFAGTLKLTSTEDTSGTPFYFHTATAGGGDDTTLVLDNAIFRSGGNTIAAGEVQVQGNNYLNDTKYGNGAQTTTLTGAITGDGTLAVSKGSGLHLSGSLTDFTGKLSEGADGNGTTNFDFGGRKGEAAVAYGSAGNIFGTGVELTTENSANNVSFRFNYSDAALSMNAVVGGSANLEQNGTGTLVLTSANTSTGELAVNKGTVQIDGGTWAGSVNVAAEGTLHLVSQGTAITDVTSAGGVVLEQGNDLDSLSGGSLWAKGDVKVTTVGGALGLLNISEGKSLTTESDLTVDTLENSGTLSMAGKNLTVENATTLGGVVSAKDVALTGDNSFKTIIATGTLTAGGNLTLTDGTSTVNALAGVSALSGAGSLTVSTGDVVLGAASDLGGTLTVGSGNLTVTGGLTVGALSGVTTLTLAQPDPSEALPKPGPMVTVSGDFTGSDTLNIAYASDNLLTELALANGESVKLMSAASGLSGLTLTGNVDLGGFSYKLGTAVDADTNTHYVTVTCEVMGTEWVNTDENGVWSEDDGSSWTGGGATAPTGTVTFLGNGTTDVAVSGTVTADAMMIDTTDDKPYVFKAVEGSTDAEIKTSFITVAHGVATFSVKTTIADTEATTNNAVLTIGSEAEGAHGTAGVLVTSGADVTMEKLVVNGNGSFTNAGNTTVLGSLVMDPIVGDDGVTPRVLDNTGGKLSFGDASAIGTIKGGDVTAAAGSSTVAGFDAITSLTVADGAAVTLTADGAQSLAGLSGAGAITAEKADVTLTSVATGSVDMTAKSLTVVNGAVGSTLGALVTDTLKLDVSSVTQNTAAPLLTSTSLASLGGQDILLQLDNYDKIIDAFVAADYVADKDADGQKTTLTLASLGAGSTAGIALSQDAAEALRQAFAEAGRYDAYVDVLQQDGNLNLVVYDDTPRVWMTDTMVAGKELSAEATKDVLDLQEMVDNGKKYSMLDTVDRVVIKAQQDGTLETLINLTDVTMAAGDTDGLIVRNLEGAADLQLTLKGDAADLATLDNTIEDTYFYGKLVVDGMTVQVADGHNLYVGNTELQGDEAVFNAGNGNYSTGALNGTTGQVLGTVTVTGTGGVYEGAYDTANGTTVRLEDASGTGAVVSQILAAREGLILEGTHGTATIYYPDVTTYALVPTAADMHKIATTGTSVTLNNVDAAGTMHTLGLAEASSMDGGTRSCSVKASDVAAGYATGTAPVITTGAALDLVDTSVSVSQYDDVTRAAFDVSKGTEDITIIRIADSGAVAGDVDVNFVKGATQSEFFKRYFEHTRVENGAIVGDLITDYYTRDLAETHNGTEGMKMIDAAALAINPQGDRAQYGDLAGVLDSLDRYMDTGNSQSADKLAAAVAGSGVASLGMAIAGDMDRQLQAIRNRTTTMGVNPSVVNEDMPYFNAWINAEGAHRQLDAEGTYAGYEFNSWGGTVGFDVDVDESLTFGVALTAMLGEFTADAADVVEGDLENYYVSAFARVSSNAWVHTFVATVGLNSSSIDRTVNYLGGSYKTQGDTDAMTFGFLYEVGRTFALNEDATACWQPVFNVAYRHINVDGYAESGSDAALNFGDQTLDTVTFGFGARFQAIVGESIYNRASIFEARVLGKVDAGDTQSELQSTLRAASQTRGLIRSAEMDAVGLEIGAGLTIPMGQDSGSVFIDGAVEFRGDYFNANGTVGYRINF